MRHPALTVWIVAASVVAGAVSADAVGDDPLDQRFSDLRPVLQKFCLNCHSTAEREGELDLERFSSVVAVRGDLAAWRKVVEMLEDFMQQRLFALLGMVDTTFWPNEEQLGRLAKSYRPNAAKSNFVIIWMVQHGGYPGDGAKAQAVFTSWALDRFGK